MLQYVKWANLTDLDAFWTDQKVKRLFKNHIYAMTSRINIYNGAPATSCRHSLSCTYRLRTRTLIVLTIEC